MSAFPSYDDYRRFLERHSSQEYEQGCYYKCAMAILGEGPVGEGYSSDIDLDAPDWFGEHERRAKAQGMWQGKTRAKDVLAMLLQIDPEGCYPIVCRDRSVGLHRCQTVEFQGWRIRFDVTEPSREFLANFARGCSGSLFEAVFDAEAIGRGPFSVNERLEVRGDKKIAVLGSKVEPSLLAGPRCAKTRHLRAYRVKK